MPWVQIDTTGSGLAPVARFTKSDQRLTFNSTATREFLTGVRFVIIHINAGRKELCVRRLLNYESGALRLVRRSQSTITINNRFLAGELLLNGVRDGAKLLIVREKGREVILSYAT